MHLRPHPLLLFILDGEADICIGHAAGADNAKKGRSRQSSRKYEVSVFSLPAQSCLVVPPDVAHSDGSTPHWERPFPENARSQIMWLQILPTGALVHVCSTKGLSHTHSSTLFVRDLQLSPLMNFFLERANQSPQSHPLLASFVQTFLLCFDSSLALSRTLEADTTDFAEELQYSRNSAYSRDNSQAEAFERACFFIGSHLTDALSPAQIARHTHTSVSQLSRIFHAQLEMPVMKYVAQRRLEEAKSLLLRTNLTTQEVGQICGYPHRTHFSRVFKQQTGLSPNTFRRQAASKQLAEGA